MVEVIEVDLPFGYPAVPVLSPGVLRVVDTGSEGWDDRLWDILFVSNAPGTQTFTPTLRRFAVQMDLARPDIRSEQFVREDVDGVPHLYLLEEWNAGHRPTILLPQVSLVDKAVGLEAILG